jgi:hypothetical protein
MEIPNTEENREQLAREMVDAWDMDDLRQYAIDRLEEYLKGCGDFQDEWKTFYMED